MDFYIIQFPCKANLLPPLRLPIRFMCSRRSVLFTLPVCFALLVKYVRAIRLSTGYARKRSMFIAMISNSEMDARDTTVAVAKALKIKFGPIKLALILL